MSYNPPPKFESNFNFSETRRNFSPNTGTDFYNQTQKIGAIGAVELSEPPNTYSSKLFHEQQSHQWMWYLMSYPFTYHILCFIQLHFEVETQEDWMELVSVVVSLGNERNLKVHSEKPFHEL